MRRYLPESAKEWLLVLAGAVLMLGAVGLGLALQPEPLPLKPQTAGVTIPWLPETVKHWQTPIAAMAKKYNIDPNVLAIVMTIESGGYARAKSEAEAEGLMQVTPPTAQDIAAKYLKKPAKTYNLADPATSIEFGAAYLAYLRQEFGEPNQGPSWDKTVELITAGYNGGPGAAGKLYRGEGLTDTQTVVYSRDAYNMWRERHAPKSPTYERWLERGGSRLIDLARAEQQSNQQRP